MKRLVAAFCAALALTWCAPAAAAITVTNLSAGSGSTGSLVSTTDFVTTVDAPAGAAIIGLANLATSPTGLTITDSAATPNTYTVSFYSSGTAGKLWMFYAGNPLDLPAPCTVTATETATTLVVSAAVTCSGAVTFTVGQTISGGSFTGKIATSPCTLVAGAATCAITGGATVASPATATVSSTITLSWSTSTSAVDVAVITASGLATSPLDLTGAGNNTGSPGTGYNFNVPASGSLGQANELLIARTDTTGGTSAYTQSGSWLALTKATHGAGGNEINWSYQVVSSTSAVAYAPSWTTSRAFAHNYYTFKAPSVATGTCGLLLLGVSHPC